MLNKSIPEMLVQEHLAELALIHNLLQKEGVSQLSSTVQSVV